MKRVLALACVASLALGVSGCSDHDHILGLPLFRMYEQNKNKPYTLSDVFENGRAMRAPVEGTVAMVFAQHVPYDEFGLFGQVRF